jgi:hypothetical protein
MTDPLPLVNKGKVIGMTSLYASTLTNEGLIASGANGLTIHATAGEVVNSGRIESRGGSVRIAGHASRMRIRRRASR